MEKYATGCKYSWIKKFSIASIIRDFFNPLAVMVGWYLMFDKWIDKSSNKKKVLIGCVSLFVIIASCYLIAGIISLDAVSSGHDFVGSSFWIFPWKVLAAIFFHG